MERPTNGTLHYGSLVLFGLAITLSNVPLLTEESLFGLFGWTMTAGGVGITLAAARPLVNGDANNLETPQGWTVVLAAGAVLMMAGAILRLTTAG